MQGDIPTSVEWISDTHFITGLVNTNKIIGFDIETNQKIS